MESPTAPILILLLTLHSTTQSSAAPPTKSNPSSIQLQFSQSQTTFPTPQNLSTTPLTTPSDTSEGFMSITLNKDSTASVQIVATKKPGNLFSEIIRITTDFNQDSGQPSAGRRVYSGVKFNWHYINLRNPFDLSSNKHSSSLGQLVLETEQNFNIFSFLYGFHFEDENNGYCEIEKNWFDREDPRSRFGDYQTPYCLMVPVVLVSTLVSLFGLTISVKIRDCRRYPVYSMSLFSIFSLPLFYISIVLKTTLDIHVFVYLYLWSIFPISIACLAIYHSMSRTNAVKKPFMLFLLVSVFVFFLSFSMIPNFSPCFLALANISLGVEHLFHSKNRGTGGQLFIMNSSLFGLYFYVFYYQDGCALVTLTLDDGLIPTFFFISSGVFTMVSIFLGEHIYHDNNFNPGTESFIEDGEVVTQRFSEKFTKTSGDDYLTDRMMIRTVLSSEDTEFQNSARNKKDSPFKKRIDVNGDMD
jgi:hypothetical protein